MPSLGSQSLKDLSRILDLTTILRYKENSLFSPFSFKIYRGLVIRTIFATLFKRSPKDSLGYLGISALGILAACTEIIPVICHSNRAFTSRCIIAPSRQAQAVYESIIFVWTFFIGMILSCVTYSLFETNDPSLFHLKLKSLALLIAVSQFWTTQLILISRNELIDEMVISLRMINDDIQNIPGSQEFIREADKKSRKFAKTFGIIIFINLPLGLLQGTIRWLTTGETTMPFEMSIFGMPTALGWVFQLMCMNNAAIVVWGYFCIINNVVYQLAAYTSILSHMLRERPLDVDADTDRKMLKLFSDTMRVKDLLRRIYDLVAFIEVLVSSGRCCFASYHSMTSIAHRDYNNLITALSTLFVSVLLTYGVTTCGEELLTQSDAIRNAVLESKWYESSPSLRSTLLPLLTMNQNPIQFHFRRFVYFNMDTFKNVLQSTYTMTTALANFT